MKRSELVFVCIVFTVLITGFALERRRDEDPFASVSLTAPGPVDLPPIELDSGHESLAGRVLQADGSPAADVGVHLYRAPREDGAAEPLPWARTGPDGRFRIDGAPSGEFQVALLFPGHPAGHETVTLPAEDEPTWSLPPASPAIEALPEIATNAVSGRVLPPAGDLPLPYPVGGYEVLFEPVGGQAEWLAGAVPRRVTVDAQGAFALPDLAVGRYAVRVLPGWATGGSWPVLAELSYAHPAPPAAAGSLSLRLTCGTLGGRAFDSLGRPLEGALVKVWPDDAPERPWPPVATDAQGEFVVRDLPPATYRVRLRAGAAEHEESVPVQAGQRTAVPLPALDAEAPATLPDSPPGGH